MKRYVAVVIVVVLSAACGSPTAPTPSPSTVQTQVNLSGIVTDEDGAAIVGASVRLSNYLGSTYRYTTSTDANGRYEFDVTVADPVPRVIRASTSEASNIQMLTWPGGSYTLVKNMRVRRMPTITLGQSMVITMDQDSSVCVWEFSSSQDTLCADFFLQFAGPTRVTVVARPLDGGAAPSIGWENPGSGAVFSLQFNDTLTHRLWMNLAIPRGAAPQRYEVTASSEDPSGT